MPANSSYVFTSGQILTAVDLNNVFAQTVAFAADSSNANTGTLPEPRLPYRMDQDVSSNSDVQFNNLNLTGNITVSGTTTFVNTAVLDIADVNITLAKGAANSSAANTGGFNIDGAGVSFTYNSSTNNMVLTHNFLVGNARSNVFLGFDSNTAAGGRFIGNANANYEIVITNANTSSNAGSSFVATADGNTAGNNFVTIGINNSLWSNSTFTIGDPLDGYLYTNTGNLVIGTATVKAIKFFANGTLSNNEAMQITSGGNVVVGWMRAGATALVVGNSTVNVFVNSTSYNIGSAFTANSTQVNAVSYSISTSYLANTTGLYHTGTVNAASHTVGANLIANSTGLFTGTVNAASITTSGVSTNTSGVFPTSNSSGSALGNSVSRWVVNANTVNASGLITGGSGATISGTANVSTAVNVGANVNLTTTQINVGNSTVNSVVNSTAVSTTTMTVNALVVTSSITIGNSSTNTTSFDVGNSTISDTLITTDNLSVINNTNTSTFYASTSANVASQLLANSTGVFVTNRVNAASFAVGSAFTANSTLVNAPAVNATSVTVGSVSVNSSAVLVNGTVVNSTFFAATANNANNLGGVPASSYVNTSGAYTISGVHTYNANVVMGGNNVIIANGGFGNVNFVLSSNGSGMYWADLTVSSVNTLAQYVWTNTHTHGNTTQTANVVFADGSKIVANGAFGTNRQVLTSNGSSMYWGNGLQVYYANGSVAYP